MAPTSSDEGYGRVTAEQTQKAAIRERVWQALEASGVAPVGTHGRIPNFVGSDQAADRLTTLAEWQQARTLKANPDQAQQSVRAHALRDHKLLFMAVPQTGRRQAVLPS